VLLAKAVGMFGYTTRVEVDGFAVSEAETILQILLTGGCDGSQFNKKCVCVM